MAKAQAGVEYITLVVVFMTIALPLILLFFSQTSIRSEPLKQDQASVSLNLLKMAVENAFARCPANTTITLNLPEGSEKISLLKTDEGRPALFYQGKNPSFIPLDIKLKDSSELVLSGEVLGSGVVRAGVACSIDDEGNYVITMEGGS